MKLSLARWLLAAALLVPTGALSAGPQDGPDGATLVRVAPGILRIIAENCEGESDGRAGSGFAWTSPDKVVTDLHVVIGCRTISVVYQNLGERQATVARITRKPDLALLQVSDPPKVPGLELSNRVPDVDEALSVFGYALGQPTRDARKLRLTFANVESPLLRHVVPDAVRLELLRLGFPDLDTEVLRVDGPLLPGHSGAPLIDYRGQVVGVGSGGLERGTVGIGWAVRAQYIQALLASSEPMPKLNGSISTASFASALPRTGANDTVRCGGLILVRRKVVRLAELAATSDDPDRLDTLSRYLVDIDLNAIGGEPYAIWTEPRSGAGIAIPASAASGVGRAILHGSQRGAVDLLDDRARIAAGPHDVAGMAVRIPGK